MRFSSVVCVGILCGVSNAVYAGSKTVLHVPADYGSIQIGIDAAVNGDTVLVEPGYYYETIDFLGKEITVISQSGSGATTIDGSTSTGSVVTFMNGETNLSVLEGFKIRGGTALLGGGVFIQNTSPTIRDCNVTGNLSSLRGGGIYVDTGVINFENVMIQNNTAQDAGGGLYHKFSEGSITEGSFVNNNGLSGGAIYAKDGSSSFTITNVTFQGNGATLDGGGIFNKNHNIIAVGCSFDNNVATNGGGWFSWSSGDARLTDCIFSQNSASNNGGAANIRSNSMVLFIRCTFDANIADSDCDGSGSGGVVDIVNSSVTLEDPILCGNLRCDVFNDFSGDAPVIVGSITTCAIIGACCGGAACWEMYEVDCLNGGGMWNGEETACAVVPCVGVTAAGACCISDQCVMTEEDACFAAGGLFEGVSVSCELVTCTLTGCPADLTGDGIVSVTDLLEVIAAWGACP